MDGKTLRGIALHSGAPAAVTFLRAAGPLTLEQRGEFAVLAELSAVRTDRGVRVATRDGRVEIDLVEHLLAAIGALRVRDGVRIVVEGDELPLLDGGAGEYVSALRALAAEPSPVRLVVHEERELSHGGAVYRFTVASGISISVDVAFRAPVGRETAVWDGDPEDFCERFANARTFGWEDELGALRESGRALSTDFSSVLVFSAEGGVLGATAARGNEVARHKLLDLVGDLALYGGPPRGRVAALRPGHTATHAVVREALRLGVLGPA